MSNPLALLPLAIAAGHGHIEATATGTSYEAQQLIAAGLTLLQRSAPLVRALSGKRSAILLPSSPAYLTAHAASDGRGAVLIGSGATPAEIAFQCNDAGVGAVFTTQQFISRLPGGLPFVLLDDAPRIARVITADRTQDVDLGTHHGLLLEGESDADGRDEEAVIVYTQVTLGTIFTHRDLLASARSAIETLGLTSGARVRATLPFSSIAGLTVQCAAPLLAGACVIT